MKDRTDLTILDLAAASQNTVSFITEQGHSLFSQDLLMDLDQCFGEGAASWEAQEDPAAVEAFVHSSLDFPEAHFDGALLWESLEHLRPNLMELVIERLHYVMKPGGLMLAVFQAEPAKDPVPIYSNRIQNSRTIQMLPRGSRNVQHFPARNLERMFHDFAAVKFFLARDGLRELLIKR